MLGRNREIEKKLKKEKSYNFKNVVDFILENWGMFPFALSSLISFRSKTFDNFFHMKFQYKANTRNF
jgi:hypothetical protein